MTESTRTPDVNPSRASLLFPTLTAAQIARIEAHGVKPRVRSGEGLLQPGARSAPFFVVPCGETDHPRPLGDGVAVLSVQRAGACHGCGYPLHASPECWPAP